MTASRPRCASQARKAAILRPSCDQAGQRRAGPGFHQSSGLSAVVARAARYAQVQGAALSIRQAMDLGAEAAPAATQRGIRRLETSIYLITYTG